MSVVHTYPVDDLREHDTENFDACICAPEVREVPGTLGQGWQIIHNSFDGRERGEERISS